MCCQKSIFCLAQKFATLQALLHNGSALGNPKGPATEWSLFRPICQRKKIFMRALGRIAGAVKFLQMQLHPLKACQLFSQCDGTLSPNAHKVVRLNNAHRRLSSVWFVTGCPCGCSRLMAHGFQGLGGFQSPSSRWGKGYVGSCSVRSITVPNLPCVTGTPLPLQQKASGKPLVRETATPSNLT